jgi:hypothetical protein
MFKVQAKKIFLYFSGLPWNIFCSLERTLNANKCQHPTGIHHPLDGVTNPKLYVVAFHTTNNFFEKRRGN